MAEGARGGGQPGRAAVRADRRRLEERRALDRERARPHRLARPAHDRLGLAGQVGLVQGEPVRRHHGAVGDHLVAGRQAHEVARRRPGRPGTRRSTPSRTTTASGATSAASRSSARLERISWNDPIAMFETRIPRNSASCHDPNVIVSTPKTSRIPFGMFSVLARTMLA